MIKTFLTIATFATISIFLSNGNVVGDVKVSPKVETQTQFHAQSSVIYQAAPAPVLTPKVQVTLIEPQKIDEDRGFFYRLISKLLVRKA